MNPHGLARTPLWEEHKNLKARLVPFAGYDMPVQYTGLIDEHQSVRNGAGIFDVSHMGIARVEGAEARAFLNHAVTRDLSKLAPGKAAYTLLCQEDGGTIDDLIVYCESETLFYLVLNASNKDKDFAHLKALSLETIGITLTPLFESMALLALQGPTSFEILKRAGFEREIPPTFSFESAQLFGHIPVKIAFTGYTGERGCEIFVEASKAVPLWRALLEKGAALGLRPAGLGARDTLRTEMGYSLYGHELSHDINPIEAGLSWAVGLQKDRFVGKAALLAAKANPARKLICLKNDGRQAPRQGMPVHDSQGSAVGEITSGTFAPSLGYVIGMALVSANSVGPYTVDIRGNKIAFETTKRPFYKDVLKHESAT